MEDWVYKMVEDKFVLERTSLEDQWKMRETRMQETLRLERIELGNRLNQLETGILTETKRMLMDPNPTPIPKNMELRFSKKISQPILTCHEIKGEDNTWIEVVLIDSFTGNKVEFVPVASATVEIVVLANGTDDCTGEEFSKKIVTVEGRKKPLLTVNACELQGGIVVLKGVKFRHHATQVKPTKFRLGARIVDRFDGIIVKEAKTESFDVKCYRNKYSMKKEIPDLTDKLGVLENIQQRGKINERLQAKGVDTIEKFLILLLLNHQELQDIALSKGRKWEATVNHARKCQSNKMYWYMNPQENSGVVFDILGKLQGMYSEGEYAATDMLSENKKVDANNLLSSAFGHWEHVTSFDDPNSLQEYLATVNASFHASNSLIPGHPVTNPNVGASEMIEESSNIEFPNPLFDQEILNSCTTTFADYDSFDIHDVEFIDDIPLPLDQHSSLNLDTMFTDFDHVGYLAPGSRIDGTGRILAESEVVVTICKATRKWKTLSCVSKWIFNRKKLNFEANSTRKKQKTC